ncbi:MAG: hypothetical protein KF746_07200 [Chitinophagaceae bacterium]|nr:hypothetical protein [Chitinophagaceae bacterium]
MKIMKHFLVVTILLMAAGWLASCKKDNADTEEEEKIPVEYVAYSAAPLNEATFYYTGVNGEKVDAGTQPTPFNKKIERKAKPGDRLVFSFKGTANTTFPVALRIIIYGGVVEEKEFHALEGEISYTLTE